MATERACEEHINNAPHTDAAEENNEVQEGRIIAPTAKSIPKKRRNPGNPRVKEQVAKGASPKDASGAALKTGNDDGTQPPQFEEKTNTLDPRLASL